MSSCLIFVRAARVDPRAGFRVNWTQKEKKKKSAEGFDGSLYKVNKCDACKHAKSIKFTVSA